MEPQQLLKVMVPVGVIAVLLILVGVVIALNSGDSTPTVPAVNLPPPPDGGPPPARPGDPPPASPKYDFPLDSPEWKELSNGLKIWDVREGTGRECPRGASVKAHYTGWRVDGYSFDSSRRHGSDPSSFSLNMVVKGWTDGIPGMKVGGVRRLFIPSALGYGPSNKNPGIPPNSDLIFEVELTAVN